MSGPSFTYPSVHEAVKASHECYGYRQPRPYISRVEAKTLGSMVAHLFTRSSGPFIEVGGPTPRGYDITRDIVLPRRIVVTSDTDGPGVEKIVHARSLDFQPGSVGAFFASYLPFYDPSDYADLHKHYITQAKPLLEEDGLFVMQGAREADILHAADIGYAILQIVTQYRSPYRKQERWDFIASNSTPHQSEYTLAAAEMTDKE